MTGIYEESIDGPSVGSLIQCSLLLVTLVLFQIFKPTALAEKGYLFLRLISSVFTVLACAVLIINLDPQSNSSEASEDFFFLVTGTTMLLIVGLVLPGIFITSYPSLQEYFGKGITTVTSAVTGLVTGMSRILRQEN